MHRSNIGAAPDFYSDHHDIVHSATIFVVQGLRFFAEIARCCDNSEGILTL